MEEALAEFLRHLALEKNASAYTVKSYREDLTQAIEFFRTRHGGRTPDLGQLNTRLLRAYQVWLHEEGYANTCAGRGRCPLTPPTACAGRARTRSCRVS